MIDISKLDRAQVLAALYNASRPQGMGFLQYKDGDMTAGQAAVLLKKSTYFDYLHGRVMKVRLDRNDFDPRLYDRDLGDGAAMRALQPLFDKAKA